MQLETHGMWQVTCDMLWGWAFSQNVSILGLRILWFKIFLGFGGRKCKIHTWKNILIENIPSIAEILNTMIVLHAKNVEIPKSWQSPSLFLCPPQSNYKYLLNFASLKFQALLCLVKTVYFFSLCFQCRHYNTCFLFRS